MTGQPDHACSQHSGLSSHHDDTAALGNKVRRQTTATRQNKPPSNASQGSEEWLRVAGGSRVHCSQISLVPVRTHGTKLCVSLLSLSYLRPTVKTTKHQHYTNLSKLV